MRFFLWSCGYIGLLIAEVAVLPGILGVYVPAVAVSWLVLGIAFQGFPAGLVLAVLAGLARDIIAPSQTFSHFLASLLVFFAMRGVLRLYRWDESFQRPSMILSGLLTVPLAEFASSWTSLLVSPTIFGRFEFADFIGPSAVFEVFFTAAWFSIFLWFTTRWLRHKRSVLASRI